MRRFDLLIHKNFTQAGALWQAAMIRIFKSLPAHGFGL
jgi:hypothetical protein